MSPNLRALPVAAAIALSLGIFAGAVSAQSQSDTGSVAEAARRAREQKKNAKPVRTLTNDDLPPAPLAETKSPAPSTEPATPTEEAATNEKASGSAEKKAAATAGGYTDESRLRKKAAAEAALKQAKADLALSEHELDILQRKAILDSDSYYSQTNYSEDTAGKARLDDDGQQISDKKTQVDALKTKIADLEAELAQLGEPEKPATDQPK